MKKIYVKKSGLHGKGLFASRDIKKGERVFTFTGQKVKYLIDNQKKANLISSNIVGIGKNTWIRPQRIGFFYNHSCDPNTAFRGKVNMVAKRNIKDQEEITFDYSLNESDIFWQMKCNCGSKNCRHLIRSIQFIPLKPFKKRVKDTPRYFKSIYKKFNRYNFETLKEFKFAWVTFINIDD